MNGTYTQSEINHLKDRIANLESQGRKDAGAKQELENLKYELKWALSHKK